MLDLSFEEFAELASWELSPEEVLEQFEELSEE
jgi:hypothetical protein